MRSVLVEPEVRPGLAAVERCDRRRCRPTTLLRTLPSPVPTQTIAGLAWWIASAPIAATGWSSKTGFQVRPPLIDFQTPPVAAPT